VYKGLATSMLLTSIAMILLWMRTPIRMVMLMRTIILRTSTVMLMTMAVLSAII